MHRAGASAQMESKIVTPIRSKIAIHSSRSAWSVVGEAADLIVVHALLVEGGNSEHVAAPSLHPHSKLPRWLLHCGPIPAAVLRWRLPAQGESRVSR